MADEYSCGRAIVFGSRFVHSTEPGEGRDGELHALLCFTFGTDDQAAWPHIEQTVGKQSRFVRQPDGVVRTTPLGEQIELLERLQRERADGEEREERVAEREDGARAAPA